LDESLVLNLTYLVSHHAPYVPFYLVATKIDLRENKEEVEIMRAKDKDLPISPELGESLAQEVGARKYMECSALKQIGTFLILFLTKILTIRSESPI
jgi:GTPase SAR1 family protein